MIEPFLAEFCFSERAFSRPDHFVACLEKICAYAREDYDQYVKTGSTYASLRVLFPGNSILKISTIQQKKGQ